MTDLLLRLFVKHASDTSDPAVRAGYGRLAGVTGIVCNLLLFALKLLAGTIAGSVSITADAVNNLSDASGSIVTLVGFKLASRPADNEHPYGHARMEYLSGLAVAVLILVIGVELVKSSVGKILHPEAVEFSALIVVILVCSILVKLWMAVFNRKLGRRIGSAALTAAAADSRNDVISTGAVLLACIVGQLTGLKIDGYVGLVIHYDPIVTDDPEVTAVHTRVTQILRGIDPRLSIHDFRMVSGPHHANVIFDMVIPAEYEDKTAQLRREVEAQLQDGKKVYHLVITFDTAAFNEMTKEAQG